MTVNSRRFALKAATEAEHRQLDRTVSDLTTPAAYARYLRGLAMGRLPIEAMLTALDWPAAFGGWRPLEIAGALRDDLADLKLDVPPMRAEPATSDVSALLGLLYVLEGSALGARLVYGRARALGFSESYGARHLAMQSDGPPLNWKAFLGVLDDAAPFDEARAAAAAKGAFARMQAAMENADA